MPLDELADEPDGDEMGMGMGLGDEKSSGPMDEFEREFADAFDESKPMAERAMAMKEAIRLCVEKDEAGGYGSEPPPRKGKGPELAIVFGGPEKKRK